MKQDVIEANSKEQESVKSKFSDGYGGKYGVQKDRVDKSAMGYEYQYETTKHSSQTDYKSGFGGKFGVESEKKDKSAVGFDHVEKLSKHSSQTGMNSNVIKKSNQRNRNIPQIIPVTKIVFF